MEINGSVVKALAEKARAELGDEALAKAYLDALGGSAGSPPQSADPPPDLGKGVMGGRLAKASAAPPKGKPAGRGAGGRRGKADEETVEAVLGYIRQHDRTKTEEITAGLGIHKDRVKAALAVLKRREALTWDGEKRSTRYSARE